MAMHSRREFLTDVGRGMIVASVGAALAADMGLSRAEAAGEAAESLDFGPMEPLVRLMQETPVNRLLPVLVEKMKSGVELKRLVAAAALANARTFGGEDYVGFHTMMALAPAFHMSAELPEANRALPILKVLYRNTNRIQEHGGRPSEVLHPVEQGNGSQNGATPESLRAAVRAKDRAQAEQAYATIAAHSPEDALNAVLMSVEDRPEVHRVVLPYRAWDLLDLIGKEHAQTLLRQSVRYCLAFGHPGTSAGDPPKLLPRIFDEHHLHDATPGQRDVEDAWIEKMSQTIFAGTPQQAADAAAAALADGIAPDAVGHAISLAANQLILRDVGRTAHDEVAFKPIGSVHGDSIGVHACDSANAWRNLARVTNTQNQFACLILGAYQVAYDRTERGGDFLHWQPLPLPEHLQQIKETRPDALLADLDAAVRGNMQAHAAAIAQRYVDLGHAARPAFDLLLKFAVSEDGALHAEKFYRTSCEEFAANRPAFRARHLAALARVTASEYGRPAPGMAEARELLKA
ncbi:MAG TPA: hypothetical protein VGI81_05010 [Tepidisphaeraceae bacterium]